MEKKFKFSENPTVAKAVYGAVIALLCITAIVIGIVAANNRKKSDTPAPTPPSSDETPGDNTENPGGENPGGEEGGDNQGGSDEAISFIAPVSGTVMKEHSLEIPVYSETLEAWRIHTGVDISTAEGAEVFACAPGEVTRVYSDPLLGKTVEITHANGTKTRYSNLSDEGLVTVGTEVVSGAKIGVVGDSAISELADEPHLHFEMLVNDTSVNPLDYLTEDSKRVSLGIVEEDAA